jgi:methylenetetrahydrofolate reductase (NADPH)
MNAADLARDSSIEVSSLEARDILAGRDFLWPGQRIYVSHLPGQAWATTFDTCAQVAAAGFDPVPHIPVRLLKSATELDEVLSAVRGLGSREVLLISGDYAKPAGPWHQVVDILRGGQLQKHGFTRVSVAGHPEGHPNVPAEVIRHAQIEKAQVGEAGGLEVTLVTQFFFESAPFTEWARELRLAGIRARLVAGLPGPASIARLLKLARHCGVGPSIRALSSRPRSMFRLLSDSTPDELLGLLASELQCQPNLFSGIHLYSFGGFLRTAAWLRQHAESESMRAGHEVAGRQRR